MISVESGFLHDQEQAVLVSPVLDQQDWSCARLVYQITGRGSLQFHLRPDGDNFDYQLWTASKPSDSWLIASVDLPNTTSPYQVGRPGSLYRVRSGSGASTGERRASNRGRRRIRYVTSIPTELNISLSAKI